jgi:hypothetical protein
LERTASIFAFAAGVTVIVGVIAVILFVVN